MNDPRAENCRKFAMQDGKVTGVELQWVDDPSTPYRLEYVGLIPEAQNQGNTVARCQVLNAQGIKVSEQVYLAWPWPHLTNYAAPGNPANDHIITNIYNPPELGYLALVVMDFNRRALSGVLGGLGLPGNHHIGYAVTFKERSEDPDPGPNPEPQPTGDIAAALWAINATLRQANRLPEPKAQSASYSYSSTEDLKTALRKWDATQFPDNPLYQAAAFPEDE